MQEGLDPLFGETEGFPLRRGRVYHRGNHGVINDNYFCHPTTTRTAGLLL